MPWAQELRRALRRMARRPGFAAVALITIALGIGATTALYSVVQGVLLRPLPYPEAERVVVVWDLGHPDDETWLSWREIVEYRQAARSFEHLAAYTDLAVNLTGGDQPERVAGAATSADAFAALGVAPLHGRTFTAGEDALGAEPVALLAHGLWRRRFGGDPAVVGSTIQLDGQAHTVVGVMPPGFALPLDARAERPPELWVPLALGPRHLEAWGDRSYYGFGRLRAEVTPAQASRELALIGRRWIAAGHVTDQGDRRFERSAVPAGDFLTRKIRPALAVLMGTAGLVLLIACVNVTHLLLAAAEERRREMAVRAALGAGCRRLVSQMLTESLLLALGGGLLGVGLAFAALRGLVALDPAAVPRVETVGLDAGALAFALAAVVATGLLFGLAPALQGSRLDLATTLQEVGRAATTGRRGRRFRRGLVALETALAVALLCGAGLMLRSLWGLARVDLGLRPQRLLTARLALPPTDYPTAADVTAFYERLLAAVEAQPGVESAAGVRLLPLTGTIGDWSITLDSRPHDPRENPNGDWQVVTPGYFETMGIPLLYGRGLEPRDRAEAPLVAVLSRAMAERYWPGEDAIGRRFRLGTDPDRPWFTIVGVAADVHHNAVVEAPRTEMYLPHAQFQAATGSRRPAMTLVVRTRGEPLALAGALRDTVRRLDPALPLAEVRTMDEVVESALSQPRFTALLLALFAVLAVALAAVGLYGVVAYAVAARTHELGIRATLGATRAAILGLVLREGLALVGAGMIAGLVLGALAGRLLAGQIYGVAPLDPATFAAVPALLLAVALLATLVPARRAAAVDPARILRGE